ncbi:6-phosphogluconolactonase [Ningiella sp. W23]|uniref:6-phosphogluconolactonase n=1 Tax=Ningiella sp. W23 TaxID=3023715 RepID=UPI0037583CC3
MTVKLEQFDDNDSLLSAFSQQLASLLKQAINTKGFANIAVSGGSTPKPLFQALSKISLPWSKVNVTLADERWVDASHEASNERLVRENLLINEAAAANFVSLTTADENAEDAEAAISSRLAALNLPFDVIILGMGEDGHTASLFPCSAQLEEGFNLKRKELVIATEPTTAPHQRMSLTLASIIASNNVFLHITGEKKKKVFEDALANHSALEKPIKAVCDACELKLVWAP